MIERTAIIRNMQGIHCRPSAIIVKEALVYAGEIQVRAASGECDLRSLIGLVSLGLAEGTEIRVRVTGPDEEKMSARCVELFETHFDFPPLAAKSEPRSLGSFWRGSSLCVGFLLLIANAASAERINHAGRILGPVPVVTNALVFNTPAADAVVSALQIMPVDNPWNEDISGRPLLTNSAAMIARINSDLASGRRTLRVFYEMNYVLVPDGQPLVPIALTDYASESDPGPYPIPANLPVETWPVMTGTQSIHDWQVDINGTGGDRHAIIVQPGTGQFWETWHALLVGTDWQAANGAKFGLSTNGLRPAGWTLGDAGGLPMFPALIRYDECQRGEIEHALRLVVRHSRAEYLYPARHYASSPYTNSPVVPAMGQRIRLKAGFAIPAAWTQQEKAVLKAFKRYGALVADNGNFFSVSAAPDDRFPAGAFDNLATVSVTNFEVVLSTGPSEGPRAPGPPNATAGPDQTAAVGAAVALQGGAAVTGGAATVQWSLYSGPGTATFGDPSKTNTTVSFSVPGTYTLLLSVRDGVHPAAYDAVVIVVKSNLKIGMSLSGTNADLAWSGGNPPFVLETSTDLVSGLWSPLKSNTETSALAPLTSSTAFFRVRGN